MLFRSLPASPNYVVRIRCLFPSTFASTSSSLFKSLKSNSLMSTTAAKTISSNSFGFVSTKSSTSQTTCHICKRLLYSFEEILVCRGCHGAYHWRCVKPETISHYGENAHFICDKCNDTITTTNTSPIHRLSTNGGIKIKTSDYAETDYRNFANIPSKLSTTPTKDTTVVNAIRYFEEKQQQQQQQPASQKISKLNEFDGHLSSPTNGQYNDESKTIHRIQQQNGLDNEDENTTREMFQANYQYTPLKEYAAMKNGRTTNETNPNGYQKSPSPDSEHQLSSRYNGGIHYSNKPHLVESPLNQSTHFTSPTIDNLSVHNRQQHFISSTNLNVNDTSSLRQQQHQQNDYRNSINHSTPYLSQIRDDDFPALKSTYHHQQQQTDRHSNVGSDSGIVMINSHHQHQISDDNPIIEKKLTDLVQQLGRQLETDAQKLSEKLELKLKNLEHMIHQQTYIIRRQDEVIERLKSKILKIESERDDFRERLSIHEQLEQDDKKYFPTTETEESPNRKIFEQDDQQQTWNDISTHRKFSNASSVTTEHSRPSTKKTAAPRVDHHEPLVNNENEPSISKLIKSIPGNQERLVSDSSTSSIATKLVSATPLLEKPAASSRLDDIIHQSNTNNTIDSPSSYYNLGEFHHHDAKQTIEPVSIEQQEIITSIHHDDEALKNSEMRSKRASSASSSRSSSSSSSSTSTSKPLDQYHLPSTNNTTLPPRSSNLHRSLESIPRKTSETERILKATNKTTSLEFGKRPVGDDDPGSIYITPQEAPHPASQYPDAMKGVLRKQNRDSFFKRIERYYCVLSKNTLLMHKHEYDTKAQKVINLKGAKVVYYEDQKYGPSLELTWSRRSNDPKRYHLYVPKASEAQQWVTAIETAIQNLDPKNQWQQYRMQT